MRFSCLVLESIRTEDERDFEDFREIKRIAHEYFKRLGFYIYKLEPRSSQDKVALRIIHLLHLPEKP